MTEVTVPTVGVTHVGAALPAEVNTCPDVPYAVPVAPKEIPPAEVIRIFSDAPPAFQICAPGL